MLGIDGKLIDPVTCTVTLIVASAMFGRLLAWMTAVPEATPVTGTLVVVAPAPNWTEAGTVAAAGLLEYRLIVTPPAGAGAERARNRFCTTAPVIVVFCCENATVALTWTAELPEV